MTRALHAVAEAPHASTRTPPAVAEAPRVVTQAIERTGRGTLLGMDAPANCTLHPTERLTTVCARCGDFTCPACTSDFPVEHPICPACIDRLVGVRDGSSIRLLDWKPTPASFPRRCPNCFTGEATTPFPVGTRRGTRTFVSWPHCPACAARAFKGRSASRARWIGFGAGLLALAYGPELGLPEPLVGPSILAFLALGAAIGAVVWFRSRTPPPGCVSRGAGVKLVLRGVSVVRWKEVTDLVIPHPGYARLFLALNAASLDR